MYNIFAVRYNDETPLLPGETLLDRASGAWMAKPNRVLKNDIMIQVSTKTQQIVGVYCFSNQGYVCTDHSTMNRKVLKYTYNLRDATNPAYCCSNLANHLLGMKCDAAKGAQSFIYLKYDETTDKFFKD